MRMRIKSGGALASECAGLAASEGWACAKAAIVVAATLLCAQTRLMGQTVPADVSPLDPNGCAAPAGNGSGRRWSLAASADTYLVPGARDHVQATLAATRGWLHLEVRYNYEALATGSLWLGHSLRGGRSITWEFTPMVGGVIGRTTGVAPGFRGSLSYWKVALQSEGEYVLDTSKARSNSFYNFSELTLAPLEWLRFGLATQRTRVYRSELDIQRGLIVGLSLERLSISAYLYDVGSTAPMIVLAAGVDF